MVRTLTVVALCLFVSAIACTKKVANAPGSLCTSVSDCGASPSCEEGFCSNSCTADSDCLDTSVSAGPTCTKFRNGPELCCPSKGCPLNCAKERDGVQPCKDQSECCTGDVCAQDIASGEKACFTKCNTSIDCKTNCCTNSGLTDGSGQLVYACVIPQKAYNCIH